MTLENWQRNERRNAALLWIVIVAVQTAANIAIIRADQARIQLDYPFWSVAVAEISSALMLLALVPALLAFDRRVPLSDRARSARNLLAHLAFSVPWSAAHVAGMVALRKLAWSVQGGTYTFDPWLAEFGYEYLKDVRTYFALLALIYLYRFVLRRLQGEAKFIPEQNPGPEPADRFLVKMLGKEFLVRIDDIDWIEAAGNYVSLHVGSSCYMLRETMTGIEKRLAGHGFVRVHRSAILRLDRVDHIEPFDSGDARAHLRSGHSVPVSRGYRQELKARLA